MEVVTVTRPAGKEVDFNSAAQPQLGVHKGLTVPFGIGVYALLVWKQRPSYSLVIQVVTHPQKFSRSFEDRT